MRLARSFDRDRLDLCRTLRSNGLEEGFECVRAPSLRGPDDDASLVVDDRRDVLVVLSVAVLEDFGLEILQVPFVFTSNGDGFMFHPWPATVAVPCVKAT